MKIFKMKAISSKNYSLNISILISLFIHIFAFLFFYKNPISNTKGDKYIPIELINIDSFSGKGESLNKKIEKDLLKINKNKIDDFKKENPEKLEENKLFKTIDKKSIIDQTDKNEVNKNKKEIIKLDSSDKTKFKTQRGNESNQNQNDIPEKGSVKGKSKIEITCLDCISPKYPTRALRRGAEGKPIVKVWINRLGNVTKSELLKTSGNESIDKAALIAANKSKFYPIKSETTLKIEYDLKIRR